MHFILSNHFYGGGAFLYSNFNSLSQVHLSVILSPQTFIVGIMLSVKLEIYRFLNLECNHGKNAILHLALFF